MSAVPRTQSPAAVSGEPRPNKFKKNERAYTKPRPDRTALDNQLKQLRKDLSAKQAIADSLREEINASGTSKGQDSSWESLKTQLAEAKKEKDTGIAAISGKTTEIRALDQDIQHQLKYIQNLRPKTGPKTDAEIVARIAELEKLADQGQLPLVEERKVLKEITSLKNFRRQFGVISKIQAEIDGKKTKLAELRKNFDDAPVKAARAKIAEIHEQMQQHRDARGSINEEKSKKWNELREALKEVKDIRSQIDTLWDEFHAKQTAFREEAKRLRKEREQLEKKSKLEASHSEKLSQARAAVENARSPAFDSELALANSLLTFFDPSHKPEVSIPVQSSSSLSTKNVHRTVEAVPEGATVLTKREKDVIPSRKELKQRQSSARSDKLRLDIGILEDLTSLNITLPVSTAGVEATKTQILEKITYFKENAERISNERLAKAEARLAKVEQEIQLELANLEKATSDDETACESPKSPNVPETPEPEVSEIPTKE